jgi:hypothetical protein
MYTCGGPGRADVSHLPRAWVRVEESNRHSASGTRRKGLCGFVGGASQLRGRATIEIKERAQVARS